MTTVEGSPVSSAKLTELGKALDQTSISNAGEVVSPGATPETPNHDVEMDDDSAVPILPTKSPKKRDRTDSMIKMLPASQRPKQAVSPENVQDNSSPLKQPPQRPQSQPAKLMVKDRRGNGMGVPRAHLILNAVKQAPPAKEKSNPRRWSKHEDESLRLAVERSGERNWKAIADQVPGRNHTQCLQRWTKVLKPGLIKGHWTPEEDAKLRELVAEGKKNWGQVASLIPGRTSKQCRERWCNHLDPNINKGSYTEDEDKIIVEMQAKLGNRWSIIAQQLKGRTEDAVKIRWKSLMRGRRAAFKDEKGSPTTPDSTSSSSAVDVDQPKAKLLKTSPSQQKNHPPTITKASESELDVNVKVGVGAISEIKSLVSPPTLETASAGTMAPTVFVKGGQTLAPMSTSNTMQNLNDLVAASIHNFQMSQRFHSNSAANGSAMYSGNSNQLMNPQTPAVYALPDARMGVLNMSSQVPLQQPSPHVQHQQMAPSYQYPSGYGAPPSVSVIPNYVVPTSFSSSNPMQMQISMPVPVSTSMSMTPTPNYPSQAMAIAIANAQYQQHPTAVHHGFSGAPLHPRVASLNTPSGTTSQPIIGSTSTSDVTGVSSGADSGGSGSVGVNAGFTTPTGKDLNTPREEWGSSQTPRSQMIMTEGHASAYELFHQQRLRLMLQERDKQGMTLSSAPSPGQALLTKELEANKERQARQAIMRKGWKSAVESMVSFNSVSDLSTLDDQQRFDGLLEKVSLSALDPTEDELLDQTVDIPADDTVDI